MALISGISIALAPVNAANYGGFGSSYSAVIDPKQAVINSDAVSSDEVKNGLSTLKNLITSVKSLETDLVSSNINGNTLFMFNIFFRLRIHKKI